MQSFFVLGYIPGTNIQVNFFIWLVILAIPFYLLIRPVIFEINVRREAYKLINLRTPNPATNVHKRFL